MQDVVSRAAFQAMEEHPFLGCARGDDCILAVHHRLIPAPCGFHKHVLVACLSVHARFGRLPRDITWKTLQDPRVGEGAQVHICLLGEGCVVGLPHFKCMTGSSPKRRFTQVFKEKSFGFCTGLVIVLTNPFELTCEPKSLHQASLEATS